MLRCFLGVEEGVGKVLWKCIWNVWKIINWMFFLCKLLFNEGVKLLVYL